MMRVFSKAGFLAQFSAGFLLGVVALVTLEPAAATYAIADHVVAAVHLRR